jgi:hypothetical protein
MDTADDKAAAQVMKRAYANVLVRLGLAKTYGVYVAPLPRAAIFGGRTMKAGFGIYLGRHDDKPMPRSELEQIAKGLR